ncbi:hypothetical protein J2T57_001406 [Natronocella acetinitrilica]|uniref:Uncharacterized protein n=1 Tax=Natronocella acetinitrilica TaxID=414046 RepID=A0AAE3G2A5_9GAMM|nr:hypothetical protein [Natronocella acetinitrilica]MCP1674304.1 hypothetical protein [Natronocella acetinitrilica]
MTAHDAVVTIEDVLATPRRIALYLPDPAVFVTPCPVLEGKLIGLPLSREPLRLVADGGRAARQVGLYADLEAPRYQLDMGAVANRIRQGSAHRLQESTLGMTGTVVFHGRCEKVDGQVLPDAWALRLTAPCRVETYRRDLDGRLCTRKVVAAATGDVLVAVSGQAALPRHAALLHYTGDAFEQTLGRDPESWSDEGLVKGFADAVLAGRLREESLRALCRRIQTRCMGGRLVGDGVADCLLPEIAARAAVLPGQ